MRALLFFACLYSLLLSGTQPVAARTQSGNASGSFCQHLEKTPAHYNNTDQGFTLIDDTDLDNVEESHLGDDFQDNGAGKYPAGKDTSPESLPFMHAALFASNYHYKAFCAFRLFSGQNPIYIRQRALRI